MRAVRGLAILKEEVRLVVVVVDSIIIITN